MVMAYLTQDLLLASVLGVFHSLVVSLVNARVPGPYMDEQFHIGQTRLYCKNKYDEWNPLITTPPALYLIASFLGFCHRERFLNSLLFPFCYAGLCRLRRRFLKEAHDRNRQPQKEQKDEGAWKSSQIWNVHLPALSTILLPVLFDTSILFYTDLLSLTATVWGLSSVCPFHSFLAFTVAIFTRQTNIVWAALYCFHFAWDELRKFVNGESPLWRTFLQLCRRASLHILLAIGFICFLLWNDGSIVLGDKSAHRPVFHLPQLLYFFAFTAASTCSLLIAHFTTKWRRFFLGRSLFIFLAFSLFSSISIHFCTMAHPYLLADNRHFTFYIWQRIFQRHWMIKYALVPIYAICATLALEMASLMSPIDKLGFVAVTALCLVPARLLEFRYFIIPYTLWRFSLEKQPKWALAAELGLHLVLNLLALHLFLDHPFRWPNKPDEWQRFMW